MSVTRAQIVKFCETAFRNMPEDTDFLPIINALDDGYGFEAAMSSIGFHRPPPPLSGDTLVKRPVAFRAKDEKGKWVLFNDEEVAARYVASFGRENEYEALFIRDGTPLNFSAYRQSIGELVQTISHVRSRYTSGFDPGGQQYADECAEKVIAKAMLLLEEPIPGKSAP